MLVAIVCEKMGWTYQEYMEQPDEFIDMLKMKWQAESEYATIKEKEKNL